jgi:hypothetical protein
MPLANHIAKNKQNTTPSQRWSGISARIIAARFTT